MALWLDGNFWGPWIQEFYSEEVDSLREALLTHMLPALPDADQDAEAHARELWESAMSQPSDGNDDPGVVAEWVQERAFERYMRRSKVRQAVLNLGTVMLWHLLEQQMLCFHRRQVLSKKDNQGNSHVNAKINNIAQTNRGNCILILCLVL